MRTFPLRLMDGYQSFRGHVARQGSYQHAKLAEEGQKPETLVIACCDSRVTPELIFSADPGSLFVVRNVANIVPPNTGDGRNISTAAALEFAVRGLKVKQVVVLGHARCGGIRAAVDSAKREGLSENDFVGQWMAWLDRDVLSDALAHSHDHDADPVPASVASVPDEQRYRAVEEAGIRQSVANLMTFDCIHDAVDKGTLSLHGAWFDIGKGELWVMDNPTGVFHWTDGVDFK